MSLASDIAVFVQKLDAAIDGAMQGPVLDGAKEMIQRTAMTQVYSYQPEFDSRRMMSGGLMDEGNMESNYGDKTLTIKDVAGWQQLYGGAYPGEELAEAIAAGSPQYHFGNAGARSFMPEAEQEFKPEFERILGDALRAAGF